MMLHGNEIQNLAFVNCKYFLSLVDELCVIIKFFSGYSFRKMFAETNNSLFSKTSPKHSKLSLSKMAVSIGHSSIMGPSEV